MDMGSGQDNRAGKTNRDDLKRFHPVEKQQTCRDTQTTQCCVLCKGVSVPQFRE